MPELLLIFFSGIQTFFEGPFEIPHLVNSMTFNGFSSRTLSNFFFNEGVPPQFFVWVLPGVFFLSVFFFFLMGYFKIFLLELWKKVLLRFFNKFFFSEIPPEFIFEFFLASSIKSHIRFLQKVILRSSRTSFEKADRTLGKLSKRSHGGIAKRSSEIPEETTGSL